MDKKQIIEILSKAMDAALKNGTFGLIDADQITTAIRGIYRLEDPNDKPLTKEPIKKEKK